MVSGHASPSAVVATTITMTSIAAIFVGMRMYARIHLARSAGLDDLCIFVSMIFAILTMATMIVQVETGMGRHMTDIKPDEAITNLKAFWVSTWVYNISLTLTKVSILIQYLRLFPQKWFRISTWVMMGITVIYGCYTVFTCIFMCQPVAFFWNHTIEGGKCLDRFLLWFINAGLNIGTDIVITILPLPVLNKLELPKRQKRALMLVFALGGFTCIISIFRLQSLYVISRATDVSWKNPLAAIWSTVEMTTGIIACCLPTIRGLFPKLLQATSFGASYSFKGQSNISRSGAAPGGAATAAASRSDTEAAWSGSGATGGNSSIRHSLTTKSTTTFNRVLRPSGTKSHHHHHSPAGPYHIMPDNGNASHEDFCARSPAAAGMPKNCLQLAGKASKSQIRAQDSSIDDIELHQHVPFPQGKIHVMTSIEQERRERHSRRVTGTKRDADGDSLDVGEFALEKELEKSCV